MIRETDSEATAEKTTIKVVTVATEQIKELRRAMAFVSSVGTFERARELLELLEQVMKFAWDHEDSWNH